MKERLMRDMKAAMKSGDRTSVETLRMLLAAHKNEEIARGRELAPEESVQILKRAVKSRQDAIALYEKGGRRDRAEAEKREIEVVRRYLPAQLSEQETERAVDAIVAELGLTAKRDMGRLMQELMARYPGQVDGRLASRIAATRLT